MAVHKWRKRPTKHFGDSWVPFAQIELTSQSNKSQTFAVQIDSGAVVSLLRKSVADLLDIELESGKKIDVSSVGGAKTIAYIHELQTRFDDNIVYPVPYAIADTENVPNLLGRLAIFDHLQINFDGTMQETTISSPWLEPDERRIWEYLIETEKYILDRYKETEFSNITKKAAVGFLNRASSTIASLVGLKKEHSTYAAPALIRSLLELALQFEYLMQKPEERSQQYIDYSHVSKYKFTSAVANNPTGFVSRRLANSTKRAEGEKRNQDAYDKVKNNFLIKLKNNKTREASNWYKMTVRKLAEELGRVGEYRLIYAACSKWAHGDPDSTVSDSSQPFTNPPIVFQLCIGYHARMLLNFADAGKIILSAEQDDYLKQLAKGIS